jgi:hypothetical protein
VKLFLNNSILPTFEQAKEKLDTSGVLEIADALHPEFISECREFLEKKLLQNGKRYFTITNIVDTTGSPFSKIEQCDRLRYLINKLVTSSGIKQSDENYLQGQNFRVIAGEKSKEQSMKFHYDSSILTMLVPIVIPEGPAELSGDLIAFPNIRPFTSSILMNMFGKIKFQNSISRWFMARQAAQGRYSNHTLKLRPGSIYFFWGFRTLHANFDCEVNKVRATALFFYGDPQPSDPLMKLVRARRDHVEEQILEKGAH